MVDTLHEIKNYVDNKGVSIIKVPEIDIHNTPI